MRERARTVAVALADATGARVVVIGTRSGYLLAVPAPAEPDRFAAVLPALGLADRFGHSTRYGGVLWCELITTGRPVAAEPGYAVGEVVS
ncbi:hypothetical protein [Kitasatospora sp. NPDC094015]|uniref:hypothetical protein n=1 Tax=Kitasatospora sp. NPDC094015 TaxID=3155205 RepID=UPI00331D45C0